MGKHWAILDTLDALPDGQLARVAATLIFVMLGLRALAALARECLAMEKRRDG